ncbi:LTA synthase family protein [Vibrio natriegens]|uniref:LTA synthase family protein n=1 Tax=Vibrio natriegens TaxID=691 RepID=UPI003B5B2546
MILLLFLIITYIFKVYFFGKSFYIDDDNSYINIAISDGAIISLCLILFYFSKFSSRLLSLLIKTIILSLIVFYVVDVFVTLMFNSRLYFDDFDKFYVNIDIKIFNEPFFYIILTFIICMLMFFFENKKNENALNKKIFIFIPLVFILFNYNVNSSVRSSFFKNYILVNLDSTYNNEYSSNFINDMQLFDKDKDKVCNIVPESKPKNIIVFILESWSYYHSKLFGADNDWTPRLDKLSEKGVTFKSFYANGFTTEAGLYALLTGEPVLPYSENYGTDGALGLNNLKFSESLPNKFNEEGYNTKFITSGNLNFLEKGEWLKSLGFNKIIGNESFDVKDRKFLFRSVSDEKLYDKVEAELYQNENNFIVVENVNTHQPFYYPSGDEIEQSEENAFKYADEKLANTIEAISDKDTMIIVMSDHRAMTPITNKERTDSKRMAVSRVPMFILWNKHKDIVNLNFQQTDVLPSVLGSINGLACTNHNRGAILPLDKMVSSKCVYHARGDNRSIVSVMCDNEQFDIVLDGDDSKITLEGENKKYEKSSIDYINFIRISSQFDNG